MPELPEVETVRRTIRPYLRYKIIESIELRWRRTLANVDLPAFEELVIGNSIADVSRRGKLVVLELSSGHWLTIHLRMTGELLYWDHRAEERSSLREPYLRAIFSLSDGADLLFYDTRKFGRIALLDVNGIAQLNDTLGLEPLDPSFSVDALAQALERRRRIKSLLLDQTVIAGLGNIYVDETLFRAGVHPLQKAGGLGIASVTNLHNAIVTVLTTAVESRGTTLRDYRSGLGEQGTNQHRLLVYGKKAGSPCAVCGTPLERITVDQRTTVFCPSCQRLQANAQA